MASGVIDVPDSVYRYNQYIGLSQWGGDGLFNGKMDEFRIWNYSRSQAEIQADMDRELIGTEAGLILDYHFDEGSGIFHGRVSPRRVLPEEGRSKTPARRLGKCSARDRPVGIVDQP